MILCVGEVLSAGQLQEILAALRSAAFRPGAETAGWAAREVKHNLQLDAGTPTYAHVSSIARGALFANETVQTAALPCTLSPLLLTCSNPGMGYGSHIDNALMGEPRMRTDLAFTLFLSDPETYEGGELVISGNEGEQSIKLPAGALVLYPATSLHRVDTVRTGQRLACVGWIQSFVRDPRVREMIFDLSRVKQELFRKQGHSELFDLVAKTQSNLLRLAAEP
jgi:PKHD-type hydroxylase